MNGVLGQEGYNNLNATANFAARACESGPTKGYLVGGPPMLGMWWRARMNGTGRYLKFLRPFVKSIRWATKSPWMRRALFKVPRHLFFDGYVDYTKDGKTITRVPRKGPTDAQFKYFYSDAAIMIRLKPSTSSSSQPSLMMTMLDALGLKNGHRVLEIATGTGWNAGLMSVAVGDDRLVYSIDNQADLVKAAKRHLARVGLRRVNLKAGDGGGGWGHGKRFDRMIVTAGSDDVPRAWQRELVEGGVLVLPFHMYSLGDPVLRLEKRNGTFSGRFIQWCGFMPMTGEHGVRPTGPSMGIVDIVRKLQGISRPILRLPKKRLKKNWWDCMADLLLFLEMNGMTFRSRWLTDARRMDRRSMCLYSCEQRMVSFSYQSDDACMHGFGDRGAMRELKGLMSAWMKLKCPGMKDYLLESCEKAAKGDWQIKRRNITFRVTRKES